MQFPLQCNYRHCLTDILTTLKVTKWQYIDTHLVMLSNGPLTS